MASPSFYPRPDEVPSWPPANARPLLSISLPPEQGLKEPKLPSLARRCSFEHLYTLSTHTVPAAFPRSSPDVSFKLDLDENDSKERRKEKARKAMKDLLDLKDRHNAGEFDRPGEQVLWNCINRYIRKDLKKDGEGLTLLCTHANGFPKEIWEPALHHLVASLESTASAPRVDEIWCWEATNHGDSALLNDGKLLALYDWHDNARDIASFLLNYIPSAPSPSVLPTRLTHIPQSEAASRVRRGFDKRKLVVMGHSFGGATGALAACSYPSLFDCIILIDPVIIPPRRYVPHIKEEMVGGAIGRRERWSSRQEAYASYIKNPFFAAWDPQVLKIYVECGLCDEPNGGVRLKMPGFQEAVCFADTRVSYETFELLEKLNERIELRWIMPGTDKPYELGGPEWRPYRVWRRPANSSNVRIPGAGHLIVQEAPGALAEEVSSFLQRKYGRSSARL